MNRQAISPIIECLTWLAAQVQVSNSINLTDKNIHSENFYRDFLNLAFGFNLVNINIVTPNAAAIDLGDKDQKFAIQVTSTSTLAKTTKTVKKFIEKKLYEEYDRLVVLNIVAKTNHKASKIGEGVFSLDTKDDVWDIGTLAAKIADLSTPELQNILSFLQNELYIEPVSPLSKNVSTILNLMGLLSDEEHPAAGLGGYLEEPDPDGKINKRFADHSDYLKSEYRRLYQEYGSVLKAIEEGSDIGSVKLRRIADHLRFHSDAVLTECDGNPEIGLQVLITEYIDLLSENRFESDTGAVRFYIVNELIKCNVFPNVGVVNA